MQQERQLQTQYVVQPAEAGVMEQLQAQQRQERVVCALLELLRASTLSAETMQVLDQLTQQYHRPNLASLIHERQLGWMPSPSTGVVCRPCKWQQTLYQREDRRRQQRLGRLQPYGAAPPAVSMQLASHPAAVGMTPSSSAVQLLQPVQPVVLQVAQPGGPVMLAVLPGSMQQPAGHPGALLHSNQQLQGTAAGGSRWLA